MKGTDIEYCLDQLRHHIEWALDDVDHLADALEIAHAHRIADVLRCVNGVEQDPPSVTA